MPDDDLSRAAQRARELWPPAIAKVIAYSLDRVRGVVHTDWPLAPELAAEVLALVVSAPDREVLLDFLSDLYLTRLDVDSAPQCWPRLTADALIAAGLVRTPVTAEQRETLIDHAHDAVPWTVLASPSRIRTSAIVAHVVESVLAGLGLSVVEGGA